MVQVWLCEAGRTLLTNLGPAADAYVERLVAPLDGEEQQHIMALLTKLLTALES